MLIDISTTLAAFVLAYLSASLIEYWAHRVMHIFPRIFKFHTNHHINGEGHGWWKEFRNYALFSSPYSLSLCFGVWLIGLGWQMGISCLLGCIVYAAFAAYAHQLQHDNPIACEWMPMPVHYVHHEYDQWQHNFGIAVDWWDKIFGTYKSVEWLSEVDPKYPKKGYFQILWW